MKSKKAIRLFFFSAVLSVFPPTLALADSVDVIPLLLLLLNAEKDCAGVDNGSATIDGCGVCDDDDSNNNTTCTQDCSGSWDGSAYLDMCNACVAGETEYVQCGEVTSTTGVTWLDRNLGAFQVANSVTDAVAYGDLYQWGRLSDGHENRLSNTLSSTSNMDVPGHSSFILSSGPDWRDPRNDTLWQGISGTNNPCPSGFRLPSAIEWTTEMATWACEDSTGAFASPLKLTLAGRRSGAEMAGGSIASVGTHGNYWTSTIPVDSPEFAQYFIFSDGGAGSDPEVDYTGRRSGYSVRCIEDEMH